MALVGIEAAARTQQAGGGLGRQDPDQVIAAGVTVSEVAVGGLTAAEAERAVAAYASRPVTVAFRNESWRYAPQTLGAEAQVDTAVAGRPGRPRGRLAPAQGRRGPGDALRLEDAPSLPPSTRSAGTRSSSSASCAPR